VTSTSIAKTSLLAQDRRRRGSDPPTMLLDSSYSAKPDAQIRYAPIPTCNPSVT
jgi:hypothetical protein